MNKFALGLLLVALTGCSTQSFTMNTGAEPTPTKEVMQPFFVSGLGQTQEIDAAEICDGVENVLKYVMAWKMLLRLSLICRL